MTAQDLKNSILQLAMQGKLVPQDPSDEPASKLEKTIQKEREKFKRNSRCIPIPLKVEDFPFDIPESWIFIRFADLVRFSSGKTPGRNELKYWDSHEIPWVAISDMVHGNIINDTKEKISQKAMLDCFPNGVCPKGTLIMSFKLTIGKISLLGMDAVHNEAIISIFPYVNKDNQDTLKKYLFHVLPLICTSGDSKNAIMGKTLNSTSLSNLIVPLPPLSEQARIVAKIEELLPFIEKYDESEKRLLELNKKFPDELRKSILQQAVQGKLTEQDPNDEPASELLKKIKAEKARLIKEGKIKKEKPLPPISEEEIPFEIPESWEWVRFKDIVSFENGDRSNKYPKDSDLVVSGIPFWGAADMINGELKYSGELRYISTEKYEELRSGKLIDGDYVCLLRGAVGKWAEFSATETYSTGFINAQMIIMRLIDLQLSPYFRVFLQSASFELQKKQNVTGSAIAQMSAANLQQFLIPIPPLAEQNRIVVQVEGLLPLCDSLK